MQRECAKCNKRVNVTHTEHFSDHDVEHFSCGHVSKVIAMEIKETISVSDSLSWNIIKDPINELKKAEKDADYYKLLSYACTIFEYYGKQILLWNFKRNNTPIGKDRIKHLTLEVVIIMLYTHKLIDQTIHTKMIQVKDIRNDFIHEDYSISYSMEDAVKMKSTSAFAIDCVIFLKQVYHDMFAIPDAVDVSTQVNETQDSKK
jgi:hypothetical protein